ncbi:hypothetical protein AZE42_09191 [Rhizopogon vesiculosus]|uniref:Uncharacterized protein n=1 Tax=Rhizopogon vesiculosus TaxID=180088 RepID=A0A1J8QWP1_9AGAM|nr:hypothetical protein AZE42_09191 [Rhizopogon vesiculosus]
MIGQPQMWYTGCVGLADKQLLMLSRWMERPSQTSLRGRTVDGPDNSEAAAAYTSAQGEP